MLKDHKFKCPDCGPFIIRNDDDNEYDSSPSNRYCPLCGENKGRIGYMGPVGFLMKPIQDGFCEGVFNPADGKTYDSRSAYYKAVNDKGLVIMGDDAPVANKESVIPEIDWKKAVKQSIDQLK